MPPKILVGKQNIFVGGPVVKTKSISGMCWLAYGSKMQGERVGKVLGATVMY